MRQADGVEVVVGMGVVGTGAVVGVAEVAGTVVGVWASILVRQLGLTLGILRTHTMGRHIMDRPIMDRPIIIRRRPRITLRCSLRR
ncbi:hypothetical protein [Candidatus Nitrotoga sp. AM1P]|uniref:hypothetical protein n=1 Tax=Candidatus Nitrotoga sp. AM1P TaxID=2559597 RepID=UPI0010B512BD|nr:hypothetical protein [Candidatus Nitrotoga sp. AM1P]BBJ24551.1 hypothetical protein W01_24780 [Candidatus Nitrotoga sp. AM1P]